MNKIFKTQIGFYPINLYLMITPDEKFIKENFKLNKKDKFCFNKKILESLTGQVTSHVVIYKKTNEYGFIILINSIDEFKRKGNIVHEVSHLTRHIWEWLHEKHPASEATAYLEEFLFNYIESITDKYQDF